MCVVNSSEKNSAGFAFFLLLLFFLTSCVQGESKRLSPVPVETIRRAATDLNLLVVVLDAAACDHLGFYGYDRRTTPCLDQIARESIVFQNAYAQAAGTMLSVYSYFTSSYPVFPDDVPVHGKMALGLAPEALTLAEVLEERYPHRLAIVANSWLKEELGYAQGFTEYRQTWDLPRAPGEPIPQGIDQLPDAAQWMEQHGGEGFYLYLHLMRPHLPYDPPEPFSSFFVEDRVDSSLKSKRAVKRMRLTYPGDETAMEIVALYDSNIAYVDHALGEMIDRLKATGIWDRTIFVLLSDHGEAFWEHGARSAGHGGQVYEEVVRVPLLIRVPGIPGIAGRQVEQPVELVDLLPTVMELKSIDRDDMEMAGRSLVCFMAGQDTEDRLKTVFTRTNRRDPPIYAIRKAEYKLIFWSGRNLTKLYNLKGDPAEKVNLTKAGVPPPQAEILKQELLAWIRTGQKLTPTAKSVSLDSLDEATLERLRALGYLH